MCSPIVCASWCGSECSGACPIRSARAGTNTGSPPRASTCSRCCSRSCAGATPTWPLKAGGRCCSSTATAGRGLVPASPARNAAGGATPITSAPGPARARVRLPRSMRTARKRIDVELMMNETQTIPATSSAALERKRAVTWEDPLVSARAGASLSGIDYLRAIASGRIPPPPIALLLGFDIEEVEEGRVVFTAEAGEHLYNPIGVVHGGVAATLPDSALACPVHSLLPQGRGYTTLEIKVNYVRAIKRDSRRLRAIGSVVHMGGKVATAEARLLDGEGRLCAHATTTCMLFGASPGDS